jgi:hypothetical protein
MDFEFDKKKSLRNTKKHGIDFETAQYLWFDPQRIVVKARSETESRYAMIAILDGQLWTAIFTLREERIRIISVRRSRDGEKKGYNNS